MNEKEIVKDAGIALSIIVPVYNVEKYLTKCVDSILNQTFRDFELILVDDGSPDRCPELCDEAARRDERIRVIHQQNGGLSAARNAGLDIARGEWIGFVDSDDYIAPQMYEIMLERVKADDAKLAVCSYKFVSEDGTVLSRKTFITEDEVISGQAALERMDGGGFTVAWNRLYCRELFDMVRFPVGKLHEDEYIAHQIYWQCNKVSVIAQPLYYYVQREGSIVRQTSVRQRLDQAEGVRSRAEFAMEKQLDMVAYFSCKGVLNILAPLWGRQTVQTDEKANLQEEMACARKLVQKMLGKPLPRAEKLKFRLFLFSPALYNTMLMVNRKLKQR